MQFIAGLLIEYMDLSALHFLCTTSCQLFMSDFKTATDFNHMIIIIIISKGHFYW